MSDSNSGDELASLAMEAIDGVMQALQVLVVCLSKSGQLDPGDYALLLSDFRERHVDSGSMQAMVIDRLMVMLVDQPEELGRHSQAEIRRAAFQLIPGGTPGPMPTAASADPDEGSPV